MFFLRSRCPIAGKFSLPLPALTSFSKGRRKTKRKERACGPDLVGHWKQNKLYKEKIKWDVEIYECCAICF